MSKAYRLTTTAYMKPLNGPERLFSAGDVVEVADGVFPGPAMVLIGERGPDGEIREVVDPDAGRPRHVRSHRYPMPT